MKIDVEIEYNGWMRFGFWLDVDGPTFMALDINEQRAYVAEKTRDVIDHHLHFCYREEGSEAPVYFSLMND